MNFEMIYTTLVFTVLLNFRMGFALENDTDSGLVALILARGGSKGIPLKNIVEIQPHQSLLGRTLETIQQSGVFSAVWVSTDHEQIALEASRHGAKVFARSATHAQDHSTSLDATREFLDAHPNIDKFALIQCTSPLLKVRYLTEAAHRVHCSGLECPACVFSVFRSYKLRWRKDAMSGHLEPINFDPTARPRRQDWSGELVETGMFYFSDRHLVMNTHSFQNSECAIVEVDEIDSLEIDNEKDLALARLLVVME